MTRVYAEIFCFLDAWYRRRTFGSVIFSVSVALAVAQGILLLAAAGFAAWLGLWCGIDKTADRALQYQLVLSIGPALTLANWLVLRVPKRQEHLRSISGGPPFRIAKIALSLVVAAFVLTLLLYKGGLPGVSDSLELITRCRPAGAE
jgi:hypothetical protein